MNKLAFTLYLLFIISLSQLPIYYLVSSKETQPIENRSSPWRENLLFGDFSYVGIPTYSLACWMPIGGLLLKSFMGGWEYYNYFNFTEKFNKYFVPVGLRVITLYDVWKRVKTSLT